MRIRLKPYIKYKFFNSLFTGLSVGSIFVLYTPLKPSIFSIGGIVLAVGMIVIAKFYDILLNIKHFFQISLFVEIAILALVTIFLINPYTYLTALLVYSGYQLTFMFGGYLLRAETLFLKKAFALAKVDICKQIGYLSGMIGSFIFYKLIDTTKQMQVYYLHFILLLVEVVIILYLIKSFKGNR